MKFPVFKNFEDYREWSRQTLFPDPIFTSNPFMSNLIDWVLYNSAPAYYWAQNEVERLAYLGCYRIIPIVHPGEPYLGSKDRYANAIICGLTHAHEFAHNLFGYPYSLEDCTPEEFDRVMQEAEWAASNFSEVVIYYLIPGLRAAVGNAFFGATWYDRLIELGVTTMPKISELHAMRRDWLANIEARNKQWAPGEKYAQLRAYMTRFPEGNEDFNHKRLERLLQIKDFSMPPIPTLSPISYMNDIRNFKPYDSAYAQLNYERLQLAHGQLLYQLFNIPNPPQSFTEWWKRSEELDNVQITL